MAIARWQADDAWQRIDLLSDVHLHAGSTATFEAFRTHLLTTPAQAVLILGDLFEVWVGDDARASGFERECLEMLAEASRARTLAFMAGNRDFLVGAAMAADCGMQLLDDPTLALAWGQRVLLSHGDALCLDDVAYQHFRAQVRGEAWRESFLSLPLTERRQRARAMRDASMKHQAGMDPAAFADADPGMATRWLDDAGAPLLVHGHTHRPARHGLPGDRAILVLGDWDMTAQPVRSRIVSWTRDGLEPIDAVTP
ncbi:UDP-2,3-diacylglucosamine diphosphatase [Ideonella sp. A 288]|uniref:UDP-2,3-diacylglucosamine diphosphatase n=1 Tax=Ideonella sp. A 288 TaxID=1962181 RepID=UPI000B4B2AF7|nr:UDP-2,3-diacylglucosamine diphosphatase [Ideonella sp. A 288]